MQFIVEKTSSLKMHQILFEISLTEIDPIKNALIDIDLSESTFITLLNSLIFYY